LGFRNGASAFAGGFEPFRYHGFGVGQGFLTSGTVGSAAGQLRHFGDKRLIRKAERLVSDPRCERMWL